MSRSGLRVLAVDDSAVMRGVLRTLFAQHQERRGELPEMELTGIVEDGVECLAAVLRLRPDVVVLDLEMPRMHGLDVLERLRRDESMQLDELMEGLEARLGSAEIFTALFELELRGQVKQLPGKNYVRCF